jgi:D-cysteine desulfhydrase
MDAMVVCSGSGGTHAGMAAAMYALRSPTKIIGLSTRHPKERQTATIYALAQKTLDYVLGEEQKTELPEDTVVVNDAYVGEGYSLPTDSMVEAVTLFARTEGVLLDPVYTGKAAAGMIDLVRSGFFPSGSNVMFLHTGGAPSLYHYMPIDETVPGVAGGGTTTAIAEE